MVATDDPNVAFKVVKKPYKIIKLPLNLPSNVMDSVLIAVWLDQRFPRMWMPLSLLVPCPERKEWRGDETYCTYRHCLHSFIQIFSGRTFLPSMWRSSRCRVRLSTSLPRRPARFLWVESTLCFELNCCWSIFGHHMNFDSGCREPCKHKRSDLLSLCSIHPEGLK